LFSLVTIDCLYYGSFIQFIPFISSTIIKLYRFLSYTISVGCNYVITEYLLFVDKVELIIV